MKEVFFFHKPTIESAMNTFIETENIIQTVSYLGEDNIVLCTYDGQDVWCSCCS